MKVLRITDKNEEPGERKIDEILESLSTFSRIECRGRDSLDFGDITDTLVLDHFDEAKDISSIMLDVLNIRQNLRVLMLVGQDEHFCIPHAESLGVQEHIIFSRYQPKYLARSSKVKAMYLHHCQSTRGLIELQHQEAANQ